MPLFDKMKQQATQVAQKAQEAGKAGQSKLEQAQAKRQADALLRRLGAAVYAQRTGGETSENVDELIAAIKAHEDEHGLDASPADEPAADAPAGDFKLE
jgi:hypothetical protein